MVFLKRASRRLRSGGRLLAGARRGTMRNDRRGLYVGLAVGRVAGVAMAQRSAAPARETVTIQLKWKHQFQFAGY